MTQQLLAVHNSIEEKNKFLAQLQSHYDLDEKIQEKF